MADYDYTKHGNYPRSGRDQLGGVYFLPRTIDKMRAFVNWTHGEYNSHRGLSNRTFQLFGVTPEQFEQAVRENPTDEGVLQWLYAHGKRPSQQEIEAYNHTVLNAGPQDEAGMTRFRANLEKLGHGHRTDVKTHMDAEDLEEGRQVPQRS